MLLRCKTFRIQFLSAVFICLALFSNDLFSQTSPGDVPDKIRGYKVYKTDVPVLSRGTDPGEGEGITVLVDLGKPTPTGVSIFGLSFNIATRIEVLRQSGTIDFITFSNVRINGKPVSVNEYDTSFQFKKNKPLRLDPHIRVSVGAFSSLGTALEQLTDSKDEWKITGRAFVFGKFRKGFFKFKRAIPVDIELTIKNPLNR